MEQLTVYSRAWSLTGTGGGWEAEHRGGGVWRSSPTTKQWSQFLQLEWGYPEGLSKHKVP